MLRAVLTHTATWPLTALAVLAILLPIGMGSSQAAYVAQSTNPNQTFAAASSFNTVAATLTDPGTPLRGVVMLNAVATSSRGMGSVTFETSPAGANTWTTACTASTSPYSCAWDTSTVSDGLRDVRAVATDSAGYSKTDTITNRRVDNTAPSPSTTDPGTPLTGTISVSGSAVDTGGSGVASSTLQYRPSGGGGWTTICTAASSIVTCSWNTAALADGLYDLRTTSIDVAGNTGTSPIVTSRLDNIAPTATMTAPAANLTGSVTLASTSADGANGTGVASVRYEYKLSSGSTWATACTGLTTPFTCSFDTSTVADGLYDFRAVAIDGVAKTGTSAAVTSRRIDNTDPTATMGALAANLSGSVSLTSTVADSGTGVASARYQYKLTTDSTWTDACSSSSSPYSCSLDTTSVSDGLYDFRAVATDNVGRTGTSAAVAARRIDNTDPTVTMTALSANLTASVTLASTPSDGSGSGVASVQYEYKLASGSTWTNACSSATTPFSCSFDTKSVADGVYDFRAVTTDNVGRSGTSAAVTARRVDNTDPTVTMTAPAANLGGTVTLASTPADTGSGVASVTYQYKPTSGSTWTNACTASSSPFSCAFDTSGVADGSYDFRAIAADNVGRTATSAAVTSRRVDNTAPTAVTLAAIGTPVTGTILETATASDAGSGVASVRFQYAPAGTTAWTDACTDATAPYTCSFDTTGAADGLYDLRALATDNAGNTTASAVQADRRIDNSGPTVTVTNPAAGAYVRGTVNVTATATDVSGVASVTMQYRLAGAPTWTTLCVAATSPYTCPLNTTTLTSGSSYEIRATGIDTLGKTTTTTPIAVTVDNVAPTAVDIQALNGGTANTMDAGDALTFTYSEAILPASLLGGWDGSATAVTVRVTNAAGNDTLEVYNAANTTKVNLTSSPMALSRDVVSASATFSATMQRTGNAVVVTLGALTSGTVKSGVKKGTMTWSPSTAATDLAGNSVAAGSVTESGANDRDF